MLGCSTHRFQEAVPYGEAASSIAAANGDALGLANASSVLSLCYHRLEVCACVGAGGGGVLRVPEGPGAWTSLRSPGHAMHWLDTYNTYPRSLPGGNLVPAAHGRSIVWHYYYIPIYL